MTSTDLLAVKLSRGFDYLDADGDGQLDEHDHVLMGERLARGLGHDAGSPDERRLVDMYVRIWRDVVAPNVPEGRTSLTRDEFVASYRRAVDEDLSTALDTIRVAAETFMEIADLDSDGEISPDEFATFMRGHFPALTESDADLAFDHLDLDGDGALSAGEFVWTTVEFWTSTDPDAPGNWWMGPLPGVTDRPLDPDVTPGAPAR